MDEARFIFEFVNRAQNGGAAPGSGAPPGGGSSTPKPSTDAGDAHDNNERQRPAPRERVPAPVPPVTPKSTGLGDTDTTRADLTSVGGAARDAVGAIGGVFGARGPVELVDRAVNAGRAAQEAAQRASDALPRLLDKLTGRPGMPLPSVEPRGTGLSPAAGGQGGTGGISPPLWVAPKVDIPALRPPTPAMPLPPVTPAATSSAARAAAGAASIQASGLAAPAAVTAGSAATRAAVGAAVQGAGTSAAGAAGAVPLAGPVGAFAVAAVLPALGMAKAVQASNQYASSITQNIAQFSPEVVRAQAMAELRQLTADMQSARRLGPEIARGIDERSFLAARTQSLKDKFSQPFIETGNDITTILGELARRLDEGTNEGTSAKTLFDLLTRAWTFKDLRRPIADAIREARDEQESNIIHWFEKQPWSAPSWWPENGSSEVKGAELEAIPGLMM